MSLAFVVNLNNMFFVYYQDNYETIHESYIRMLYELTRSHANEGQINLLESEANNASLMSNVTVFPSSGLSNENQKLAKFVLLLNDFNLFLGAELI